MLNDPPQPTPATGGQGSASGAALPSPHTQAAPGTPTATSIIDEIMGGRQAVKNFTSLCSIFTQTNTLRRFFDETSTRLRLDIYAGQSGMDNVLEEKSLNRPALALTGYFKHFARKRLQFFGTGEMSYLHDHKQEEQEEALAKILDQTPPGILVSSCDLGNLATLKKLANQRGIPVLRSQMESQDLFPEATICLESVFAKRAAMHATFVSVCGVGVLLIGASGIGKSESALSLLERGHSLVADDSVIISAHGDGTLLGRVKPQGLGTLECRGIGIISVVELFGARAFLAEKGIDMLIELVDEDSDEVEERAGVDERFAEILGIKVAYYIFKVRPGRDMARLIEVAAMTYSLRKSGCNFAGNFNNNLIANMRPRG
ncbi:MAG: HPr(Ser) kinase/phosphatase [Puniceicoccales bacterium]|nr:HPr(Ser) kinase/phosphatase [Puniceicoccales bacterium]